MDFGLSEEQEMLQQTVRGFLQAECPTSRLRTLFDEGRGHDPTHWSALAEMGLAGLIVPEEHGGAGLEVLDLALVVEVLGEAAMPSPLLAHSVAALGVLWMGDATQRSALLPGLASGAQIATVALQEGDSVWAPDDWKVRCEDGRITGMKTLVTHASVADRLLVGLQDGRLAWVDAKAEGLAIEEMNGVDRTRPFATIHFDRVEAELLEGGTEGGERLADAAAVLLAADAFGAASRLIDLDVAYSHSRKQFGQPIAQFQAIKHAIARLGADIEPTRALWWFAAHAIDHIPDERSRAASLAKAHITDRAMNVARESVELHGGYGFTWECEVQMWFKRILFDRVFLGTPEQHRARCAARAGW